MVSIKSLFSSQCNRLLFYICLKLDYWRPPIVYYVISFASVLLSLFVKDGTNVTNLVNLNNEKRTTYYLVRVSTSKTTWECLTENYDFFLHLLLKNLLRNVRHSIESAHVIRRETSKDCFRKLKFHPMAAINNTRNCHFEPYEVWRRVMLIHSTSSDRLWLPSLCFALIKNYAGMMLLNRQQRILTSSVFANKKI